MTEIPPPSFLAIIQLHHLQAMLQLGLLPNPLTGKTNQINTTMAKRELRLLEILAEKTAGNLTVEEEEMVSGAIQTIREALETVSG